LLATPSFRAGTLTWRSQDPEVAWSQTDHGWIRSKILTQEMTSSNIFGHTPFWTWNPILDISGTGSRLVTKIPWLDSQQNFDSGNEVIKN
jgi:hypothetical protein